MPFQPRFAKKRFVFSQKGENLTDFAAIVSFVLPDSHLMQFNNKFSFVLPHMDMRRKMVVGTDANIITMPLTVQYSDRFPSRFKYTNCIDAVNNSRSLRSPPSLHPAPEGAR